MPPARPTSARRRRPSCSLKRAACRPQTEWNLQGHRRFGPTASGLTVDFRGAIQGSLVGAHGILRIQTSSNVTLNDPTVSGTGYTWDSNNQNEHGIQIDGGSNITLNHPTIRDTRGDGIYVTYASSSDLPVGITINNVDIERASRSGIAPVAGQVTIRGGHISQTGLHGINFEVNDSTGAGSIVGIVDGVDIRRQADLPAAGITSYAVAAAGYSNATKPSLLIQNLTGDVLRMTIRDTAAVVVTGNVSSTSTTANFPGSGSVTFTGNTNITKVPIELVDRRAGDSRPDRWLPLSDMIDRDGLPAVIARHPRRRLVAGLMSLALIALVGPVAVESATTPQPAHDLLAGWTSTHTVITYAETSPRIAYGGSWSTTMHAGYLGGRARASNQRGGVARSRSRAQESRGSGPSVQPGDRRGSISTGS